MNKTLPKQIDWLKAHDYYDDFVEECKNGHAAYTHYPLGSSAGIVDSITWHLCTVRNDWPRINTRFHNDFGSCTVSNQEVMEAILPRDEYPEYYI